METVKLVMGSFLPYLTILVFLIGMFYRLYIWAKMPSPIMTLFPRPKHGTFWGVVKETIFFPGLFKSDKGFWAGAWIFHVMLAFIFIGHSRVFTDFPWLWNKIGMSKEAVDNMSMMSGGIAGIAIMITILLLIFRRVGLKKVREISGLPDYIIMFLLLAIVVTGNAMRFFQHFDLSETRTYFAALLTLQSAQLPNNSLFLLHFALAQMLIIFIPFSKILHLGGIFFSQTILKRS